MKTLQIFVLAALLAALPFAVAADDSDTTTNETVGSIEIGVLITDVEDSPDKAAEFSTINDGPVAKVKLATFQDWGALDFKFKYAAQDQNSGHLNFDIKRMVLCDRTVSVTTPCTT